MKGKIVDALVILSCLVIGFGIITLTGCGDSLATEDLPEHITEQIDALKLEYIEGVNYLYSTYHASQTSEELMKLYDKEYERFIGQRDKLIEHYKAQLRAFQE